MNDPKPQPMFERCRDLEDKPDGPDRLSAIEAGEKRAAPLVGTGEGLGNSLPEWADDEDSRCRCDRCGGDGFIEYLDGDGGDWGEDCPSEENHLIVCRQCRGSGECP